MMAAHHEASGFLYQYDALVEISRVIEVGEIHGVNLAFESGTGIERAEERVEQLTRCKRAELTSGYCGIGQERLPVVLEEPFVPIARLRIPQQTEFFLRDRPHHGVRCCCRLLPVAWLFGND